MTAFTEDMRVAFAWVYALTRVEPGDFAAVDKRDAAVIAARNHNCTPTPLWRFPPEYAGIHNGETGV